MIKFFKYELKRNLWTLIVLSAICTALYVTVQTSTNLFYENFRNVLPQIGIAYIELAALCTVVPMLTYSFKMNKRSVDEFYSLPIKREKMYFVKTMVGLILTLVPFTVAYWSGFLSVILRENYYSLKYYVPGYFLALLFAVCLYGINSFAFARANRVVDGALFIFFYAFIGQLVFNALGNVFPITPSDFWKYESSFNIYACFSSLGDNIARLIAKNTGADWNAAMFVYPVLLGAVGYFLLFFLLRYDRGEDAEQNSDSWFGYRVMIPVYTALLLVTTYCEAVFFCITAAGAIILVIVHTRKFLFGWRWWLALGASAAVGVLISCLTGS